MNAEPPTITVRAPAYEPMNTEPPIIEINHLVRKYGKAEAVNDLSLQVQRGKCHGFFGRNGAGKTTTIKCLLNLLQPTAGLVRVFGLDPRADEVAVKSRLAYVPDYVAFYPWMTVRDTLDYVASFRKQWNRKTEKELLGQFRLQPDQKAGALSKGQKTQLALIGAICADPELLVLDEPTSGLDPIVRREFIETVIGTYQEADPGRRTVFVSTHLIAEFEGLIDDFTIVENGRAVVSIGADEARSRYKKIRARFAGTPPKIDFVAPDKVRQQGRELDINVNGNSEAVLEQLKLLRPESVNVDALTLEEIFVAAAK